MAKSLNLGSLVREASTLTSVLRLTGKGYRQGEAVGYTKLLCGATASDENQEGEIFMAYPDFYLEKVYSSFNEVEKKVEAASTTFLLLISATSVIVFANDSEGVVKVPLIELELRRWIAAQVLLLLSCASVYRLVSFIAYARVLKCRLGELLDERDGSTPMWALTHPSHHIFQVGVLPRFNGVGPRFISGLAGLGYSFLGFLWPLYLAYVIGSRGGFTFQWLLLVVLSMLFLFMAIALFKVPGSREEAAHIMKSLDERDLRWRQAKTEDASGAEVEHEAV